MPYIIILAMVAVFLGLRLYSVLGKRTGHEQAIGKPVEERVTAPAVAPRAIEAQPEPRDPARQAIETKAQNGLRAMISADPSFDVVMFLDGAKNAYRMILEAFWKDDEETLGWLTEDHVRDAFADAIRQRSEAGHVLDNRLVSIERATIVDAGVANGIARITIAFDADIAAVTRDGGGNVVAGSLSDAVESHDVWTFARTIKDGGDWKLADTDEA